MNDTPSPEADPLWHQVREQLDVVMDELPARDREAILLRFFHGRPFAQIGAAFGLSEDAARKRVDRALDKMRDRFARRGLTSTSAALAVALTHQATAAAPAGLAAAIAGTAVASAAGAETAVMTYLAMKKIILGIAGVFLVAEFATATVELKTKQTLDAEYYALQNASNGSTRSPAVSPNGAAQAAASSSNSVAADARELARLRRRIAELKARPPGIVDSQMRPVANVGRATPLDAMRTIAWALKAGDVDALTKFVIYTDDTPENREAFMANFSETVRARYKTPERVAVGWSFAEALQDPPVSQQIMDSHTYYTGPQYVTAWTRYASGREEKSTLPFQETPQGWLLAAIPLNGKDNGVDRALARIDPVTGEVLPKKK